MNRLTRRSSPLQILCVEENHPQQRLLGACCQLIGAEPVFASCGGEAVKTFRTLMIYVVMLNLNLPSGERSTRSGFPGGVATTRRCWR